MVLVAIVGLVLGGTALPAQAACGGPGDACIFITGSSPSVPNSSLQLSGTANDVAYAEYTECGELNMFLYHVYGLSTNGTWRVTNSGGATVASGGFSLSLTQAGYDSTCQQPGDYSPNYYSFGFTIDTSGLPNGSYTARVTANIYANPFATGSDSIGFSVAH